MPPAVEAIVQIALSLWWTMRLACWPFEVEGQGNGGVAPTGPQPTEAPTEASIEAAIEPPTDPPPLLPTPPPPVTLPPRATLPASLPLHEEARYDIRYGILGSVGELNFSVGGVADAADGSRVVKVQGSGQGAVLGLGGMRRRIDAEFDPGALGSRRWTVWRLRDGQKTGEGTVDSATRGTGGAFLLERTKPGEAPSRQTVTFPIPPSDPLGLLWRLRTAPPRAGQTEILHLLDGLALWRVRVTTAAVGELLPDVDVPAIRLNGEVAPIFYDGRPDPERPIRQFSLWLSESTNHLPLRLEVPIGPADVVMTLTAARRVAQAPSDNHPSGNRDKGRPGQVNGRVPGARSL